MSPAKATRTGENTIVLVPALADKCHEAHNSCVGKILERIKAWRRNRAAPPSEGNTSEDWKTVGKTFRATDAVFDKSLPNSSNEEGRPPH